MIDVRIQAADFDPARQIERLREFGHAYLATELTLVEPADSVEAVVIEHYPALAKTEFARIAEEAQQRWPFGAVILIHRHGCLAPVDRLLFAGVASPIRQAAREACAFLINQTRLRAPFWRKDVLEGGETRWRPPST